MKSPRLAAILAAVLTSMISSSVTVIITGHYRHPLKHTWDCQLVQQASKSSYWFVRPNHEIFEMFFDNPPIFPVGVQLRDIAYTDDNADMRHFVKATLK